MTTRLLLDELTTWMAESVGIDEALFVAVGRWSADDTVPGDRLVYATLSRWFGEHAIAMRSLLPDSSAIDAPARIAVPSAWVERINLLAQPSGRHVSLESIVADRSDRDERVHSRLHPAADGTLLRHLAHTRLDLEAAGGLLAAREHGSAAQGWRG